ncbi:MAG: hypothetical protein NC483_07820 [Ruminococcus sp.]|nr:hypothetical protein [Ruminococcus sp.]
MNLLSITMLFDNNNVFFGVESIYFNDKSSNINKKALKLSLMIQDIKSRINHTESRKKDKKKKPTTNRTYTASIEKVGLRQRE